MRFPDYLLLAFALLAALSGLFWNRLGARAEFAGSDGLVVKALGERAKPSFEPLWKPPSAEVESGLFALQAAIGGALAGYVIGRARGAKPSRVANTFDRVDGSRTQSRQVSGGSHAP